MYLYWFDMLNLVTQPLSTTMKAISTAQCSSVISFLNEEYSLCQMQDKTSLGKPTVGSISKKVLGDRENCPRGHPSKLSSCDHQCSTSIICLALWSVYSATFNIDPSKKWPQSSLLGKWWGFDKYLISLIQFSVQVTLLLTFVWSFKSCLLPIHSQLTLFQGTKLPISSLPMLGTIIYSTSETLQTIHDKGFFLTQIPGYIF